MLDIAIPGGTHLQLEHLILDYNGTLACDGKLLPGSAEAVAELTPHLQVHVITADTFGSAAKQLQCTSAQLKIIPEVAQDAAKQSFLRELGPERCVAIGNGRNDRLMIKEAALGIALVQQEGASLDSLLAADVVCPNILSALGLLINPKRLIATLRL